MPTYYADVPFIDANITNESLPSCYELYDCINGQIRVLLCKNKGETSHIYYWVLSTHSLNVIQKWHDEHFPALSYTEYLEIAENCIKFTTFLPNHQKTKWELAAYNVNGLLMKYQLHEADDSLVEYTTWQYDESNEIIKTTTFLSSIQAVQITDY